MIAKIVKKFIIRGFLLLLVALIAVVVVFLFIQYQLQAPTSIPAELEPATPPSQSTAEPTPTEEPPTPTESVAPATPEAPAAKEPVAVPAESIKASSLPLTDAQKSLLEKFGIDPNEVEITPEMIACATETLGTDRYQAILGGESPTLFESASLLGCLGQ